MNKKKVVSEIEKTGAKVNEINGNRIEATKLGSDRKVLVLLSEGKAFSYFSVDSCGHENHVSSLKRAIATTWQ